MTREQFLNGTSFRLVGRTYKGDWTYKYQEGSIVRESRSSVDERLLTYSHHNNVTKVGRVAVEGFTYIFNKKVNVRLRFDELVEFKEEA
jgi:hypothetical protein